MELQEEEREVVLAIYDGDPAFNQLSAITYQYKYGEEGDPKSFLLELSWGENYPNEKPKLNMNTFYNNHLPESAKERVIKFLLEESENLLGTAMTYSLFESLKDKANELIGDINSNEVVNEEQEVVAKVESASEESDAGGTSKKKEKKERLTKAQKRKQWDRVDSKGERARGWNWMDIVSHLSQTGASTSSRSDV